MTQVFRGCRAAASLTGMAMLCLGALHAGAQQSSLPDAPSASLAMAREASLMPSFGSDGQPFPAQQSSSSADQQKQPPAEDKQGDIPPPGKKILPQQQRVFGVLANYTSVSGGTRPTPPGWRTNARVTWKQTTDYTAIGFSVVTSAIAYAQDSHPSLDTENGGNAPFWAYTWRGLADRTDGVLQGSFLFPSLLHEDTRYYAMGTGSKFKRTLHAIDSVVVARSYSGRPIPNIAGLAGKVGAQAVSTTYYPSGSEDFGVLAEKFVYGCLRQAGFTVLKEFSPDIAIHLHRHRN